MYIIGKKRILINYDEIVEFFRKKNLAKDIEEAIDMHTSFFMKDKSTYTFKEKIYQVQIDKVYEDKKNIIYCVKSVYDTYLEEMQYIYE